MTEETARKILWNLYDCAYRQHGRILDSMTITNEKGEKVVRKRD